MAKVFVNHSSCIFFVTIFVLLLSSVGLLVFVLKGQLRHAHDSESNDGHVKASPVLPKGSTNTPSAQTAPKPQATWSTAGQSDLEHTTVNSNPDVNPWEDFRLPKYIIPLHYDLLLYPNIPNDTFTGSVNITVNVTKYTNYFMVHAYRLVIKNSKVHDYRTEEEIPLKTSFLYDPHEYFVVETEKTIGPGIYKLYYKFFGSLVGSIVGFYKGRYRDRSNQTRYLATSKFQPTYARRAFPCYDEPSFKSTFTVSLVHEPGYVALSNMPVDETNSYLDTELMVTKFQTSVPMVTYLVCFIVCDFDFVRTTISAGKEFRVYAAPDQINKTEYALKFGSRVLEYFENYFGIDYPLPKQDMVAIPDFVPGAMVHWGVITFRETNLLYDKENSSPRNEQRVSMVISHEMTHMWLGNLVTMEWWDDLWLNEGFASYVEYKGVHDQYPDWDIESVLLDFGISAAELKRLCHEIEDASVPASVPPSKKSRSDVSTIDRPSIPQPAPSGIRSKDLKKSLICPLCDSKFQRKNHFLRHMKYHSKATSSNEESVTESSEDEALPEVRTVECQPEALQSSDNEVHPEMTTSKDRSELTGASTHLSQFVTEDVQPVMDLDSTMSSHPIVQPVRHPEEITEIFDDISYGKGASVLRMLEFFVGKENFRRGISQFLKKYQFKNAKTSDLWTELSEACGYQGNHTIASIMKTWTEEMGFPFISVKRIRHDQNVSIFVAEQKRFVKNEELYLKNKNSTKEYTWSVPLSYVTEDGQSDIIWIHDEKKMEFQVPIQETDWVKFNVNQTGYYLVNYEKEEWDKLIEVLMTNHELLTPSDRSSLLFDSFLLGEAGHIPFDVFLSMSKYLKNETHLIPWETAYHSFVYLCQLLEYTEVNFLLKSYVNDLTERLYKKLGWKTADSHIDNLLRTTIIGLACHSGNRKCLSDAAELFQNWTLGQEIPSSLRTLVYHYGMPEIGQEEHWNYMWNKYLAEDAPSERKALLYGLAHVRVPSLIHRYLEYAMDDQKIRRQDFFTVLIYIAGNPVGRPFVWNFLRDKWPALVDRFTLNDRYLGLAVKKICSYFTTDSELEEMKSLFSKYPDAGAGKRWRQQAFENVLNNIKWLKTYKQSVKTWFEIEGSSPWYYNRLPSNVVPEHYDLLFYPMLDDDIFIGSANITLSLNKTTDCFLVHGVQLNVTHYEITHLENNTKVEIEEMFYYDDNDFIVLKVGRKLPVGKYKLHFEFEGPFTTSFYGLYKTSYVDPETMEVKPLATTQFETICARYAFPCFDEPRFKTTFSVRIRHDRKHFALSNTEAMDVENLEDGLLETTFEKSLPMVTYLLCVVVCDYKFKETITSKGVKLRAYAAPHQLEGVDYALDFGSKALDYFETYFGVHFPLKKLDFIAIPSLLPGGMENWGLITFDEKIMIISNESSVSEKFTAANFIAHEIAHMWFGDLVTMTWWDDLWLNEGFATYMAQKGIHHVEPEFDLEDNFLTSEVLNAMLHDRTVNTHPIVQTVTNAKTDWSYDIAITYSKGSSVLGMLEKHMGDDFRKGVSAYLEKYKYANAKTKDLWDVLTNTSTEGLNVTFMMETWTKQMNYPYLTVKRKKDDREKYEIQQHRFLEDPSSITYSNEISPYNYVWVIPVTYYASNSREKRHILINSSDTVSLNIPDAEWVKFNVNFTGYYSVNYDTKQWRILLNVLNDTHQTFSPADRINLLFDSFSFASAGILDYEIPLNMTSYLKNETYYGAWDVALQNLEKIKRYFENDRIVKDLIKEHVKSLCKNLLRKFSWTNSSGSYSERKLKRIIIDAACNNGHHECLITAGDLFNQWKNGEELDPEIRETVLVHGLRVLNDDESWEFVWQKYIEETDPDKKHELQSAMTLVRNASQIERFIDAAKTESFLIKSDYLKALKKIAENQIGFSQVTSLIFGNWTDLVNIHGSVGPEILAYNVFKLYDTEKDLKKVREFYRKNKVTEKFGQRQRTFAIERILLNMRWQEMHRNSVKKWFENNVYMPWRGIRLPRHIRPSKYNITLYPNITHSNFEGSEVVEVTISKPTDFMLLHEIGLKIFNTELINSESHESVSIDEIFPYKRNNFHVFIFEEMIPEGQYVLKLDFTGTFTDGGDGIGRYSYTHRENSTKRYIIASRFEPTDARRMFPCFDEPDKKAKFTLTLIHEDNYTALSNMPVETEMQLNDNMVQTTFEESVEMSTYLLCCVICDFDYIETEYKDKKVRVYAPPDRLNEAEHGLNTTLKALEKYEEYFDVPYALPKLDSVIVPSYNLPAMEHWGVIIYNEKNFLVDDTIASYSRMLNIDRAIVHELAHQWFGNLVTMKWWNDLWLNEGFSTFIMYMPLRENYPAADQLEVRIVSKLMCTDSRTNSHPIRRNVSNSTDITDLFDNISYEKGSAVLKMLQYTLNDDFRKGLSNYLKKYAFKNAETGDLWEELSNASSMDLNITEMMNTWTLQMGFPYIELKREGDNLTATQRWFLRKKNDSYVEHLSQDEKLSPFGFIWKIPLIYKNLATGNEHTLWLNDRNATYHINAMRDDILKFNPGFVGYYIVKYDEEDYQKISKRLQEDHTVFAVIDRYNLLHDAIMLAESDRLLYDIPLEFTKYLKKEKELMPWTLFRERFVHILLLMDGNSETVILLKEYVRLLTQNLYDEMVWSKNDSSHFKKWYTDSGNCPFTFEDLDLVSTIVDLACQSQNEKCLNSLNNELQLWIQGKNITADLRLVLNLAIPYAGNSTLWNILYEKFNDSNATEEERTDLIEGLVSFTGRTEIMKTIEIIMEDPSVNPEMARLMFEKLGSNPVAVPVLWNYAKRNWDALLLRFDAQNNPTVGISIFCDAFKTLRDLGDFIRFLKTVPQINDYIMENCIEDIQEAVNWSEKYEQTLQNWLRWNLP